MISKLSLILLVTSTQADLPTASQILAQQTGACNKAWTTAHTECASEHWASAYTKYSCQTAAGVVARQCLKDCDPLPKIRCEL